MRERSQTSGCISPSRQPHYYCFLRGLGLSGPGMPAFVSSTGSFTAAQKMWKSLHGPNRIQPDHNTRVAHIYWAEHCVPRAVLRLLVNYGSNFSEEPCTTTIYLLNMQNQEVRVKEAFLKTCSRSHW